MRTGRKLAYSPKASRRRTFTDRKPPPHGRGERALEGKLGAFDALEERWGKGIARTFNCGHAALLLIPIERRAESIEDVNLGPLDNILRQLRRTIANDVVAKSFGNIELLGHNKSS